MGLSSSTPEDLALPPPVSPEEEERLVAVAWASLRHGITDRAPLIPDLFGLNERLLEPGATFVTLEIEGRLRGCIGTLEPREPLVVDVARNAYRSGFEDPRFPPVTEDEADRIDLGISVIGPPIPVPARSEEELLASLEPHVDGVILELPPHRRSTFLPQVWDSLPDGREFLAHLRKKAGLPPDFWSPELRFQRYRMRDLG
jgi:AmmeMemoRadiSam system protein A